jgi:hypothetical protein
MQGETLTRCRMQTPWHLTTPTALLVCEQVMQMQGETLLSGWRRHAAAIKPVGQCPTELNRRLCALSGEGAGSGGVTLGSARWLEDLHLEETSSGWQFVVLLARMLEDICKDRGKLFSGIFMETLGE